MRGVAESGRGSVKRLFYSEVRYLHPTALVRMRRVSCELRTPATPGLFRWRDCLNGTSLSHAARTGGQSVHVAQTGMAHRYAARSSDAVFWSCFTVYMIWVIAVANKAWIPEMEGALDKLLHPILAAYCIEPKHYNQQVSTGL